MSATDEEAEDRPDKTGTASDEMSSEAASREDLPRKPSTEALEDAGVGDLPDVDEVDVRELLRDALRPPRAAPPNLLRGVQRRIRTRSRGKFYGDGWSTSRSPRSTYLMTSILMLALIAFVFLVLIPWGGGG